jgi:hypothetical protein
MESVMDWTQTLTIIGSVLGPMLAGFGWLIHRMDKIESRLSDIDRRLTVVETILAMMGMLIKEKK